MHGGHDQVWSKIRHPNILRESHLSMVIDVDLTDTLEFLGANILNKRPFVVIPYLRNRNSRDYLEQHPNGDRMQIVCIFNIHSFAFAQ
jgi:hypothetical protein